MLSIERTSMTLSHVLTINVNYNYNQQMDYMERIKI